MATTPATEHEEHPMSQPTTTPEATEITVGTAATILLHTDTRAAVVTKISAKRIWIARVETTDERTENAADVERYSALPVRVSDGILDKPRGAGEMFTLYTDRDGKPYATKGDKSVRVRFGRSVTRIDYSY